MALSLAVWCAAEARQGAARAEQAALRQVPRATPEAVPEGAVRAGQALFARGREIRIERDAHLYVAPERLPANDRLLRAYAAPPKDARGAGPAGSSPPGLLGVAEQAFRSQSSPWAQGQTYSLADAMRDAIWRQRTAARLRSLLQARRPPCPQAAEDARPAYARRC